VIAVRAARLPPRLLLRQQPCHLAPVVDRLDRDLLRDGAEPGLVREQPAHRQLALAALRELRPVARDGRVEVERALVHEAVRGDRRDALGRRVDVRERVALPGLRALRVHEARPEIHHRLAFEREAERGADLVAAFELLGERVAHARELRMAAALDLGHHSSSSGSAKAT
jgi:hypothetical protein